MNNNVTQVEAKTLYFETVDGKHVLPASLTKRSVSRFIDIITYGFIGSIFMIIFYQNIKTDGATFEVDAYNWMFIVGILITLFSTIFFAFIYPIFINKKNVGQSLGKKLFNITPMYLNEKYNPKVDIFKREIPIALFYLFINIIVLSIGFNYASVATLYNQFLINLSENPEYVSTWEFIKNSDVLIGANGFQQTMGYIYVILSPLFFTVLLIILLSIAFGTKKRGLHDQIANTAIVDLSTMGYIESFAATESEIVPKEDDELFKDFSNISLSQWTIENFEFESEENKQSTTESNVLKENDNLLREDKESSENSIDIFEEDDDKK